MSTLTIQDLSTFCRDNKTLRGIIPYLIGGQFSVNDTSALQNGFGRVRYDYKGKQLWIDMNLENKITSILIGEVNNE